MKRFALAFAFYAAAASANAAPADEVIAAERAFAADGAKRGWIAAFKTWSAPDGIVLQPDPINAKDSLPPETDPPDTSLKWWPVWAGISQSGDLGFTTGPFTVGDDKGFGHYFTVWAKQPDGTWRWIYDGGPINVTKSPLGPDTTPTQLPLATANSGSAAKAWAEVREIETTLATLAAKDALTAYLKYLTPDARVMGSISQPAIGDEAYRAELRMRGPQIAFKPLGGRASTAGDLVYTYGSAEWTQKDEVRTGHTIRIWQKRQGTGWQLVFDELLPKPRKRPS